MTIAATDEDLARALAEHRAWHELAAPSANVRPDRVMVRSGNSTVVRAPFRRRGRWCVRWNGTGRLVDPRVADGTIVFAIDYGSHGW